MPTRTPDDLFLLVFGGIAVILVAARLIGALFRRIGQPQVVGEVVAGIVLGPSVLGALPGGLDELLFPVDVRPFLRIVASLGLVVFMFIVGAEIDLRLIRGQERAAVSISLSSIALPFALGSACGLLLYGAHDMVTQADGTVERVPLLAFCLFCGLGISGSAFAILARILDERGLFRTRMGTVIMGSAVVDDLTIWSLAAVVITVASAAGDLTEIPQVLGLLATFVAVLFLGVRPLLARVLLPRYEREGTLSPSVLAVVILGLLASACATTAIGVQAILGAFLFGLSLPRDVGGRLVADITDRLESVSVLLLLPVFFAVTGLGVDLTGLGWAGLAGLALFVTVASGGKLLGAATAARANGFPGRRAIAVGVLLNTRGLTELALLSLGASIGVLDTGMFTILVTTAVTTTIMAGPILRVVYPERLLAGDIAEAERARLRVSVAHRAVAAIDELEPAGVVVDLAAEVAASEAGSEVVITRFRPQRPRNELGGLPVELGELAASLEATAALERRVEARGPSASVLTQLTDDPGRDLLAQLARVDADLVVIDARAPAAPSVLVEAGCDVAVVDGPGAAGGSVALVVDDGADHDAAAELVLRIGRSRGAVELVLAPGGRAGRRAAAVREAAGALGVETSESTLPGSGAELARRLGEVPIVIGLGAPIGAELVEAGATVVTVRARPESRELLRGAAALAERLSGTATPAAPAVPAV